MITSFPKTTRILSGSEKKRLAELEFQIKDAFYRAGQALKEIRDCRLYRDKYQTFEDYCQDKWEIARNYANKLIAASEVVKNVSTGGSHIPKSERQARPFTSLPPAKQIDAWQEVVNTAHKGRITTALCEKVAKKYKKMSTSGTQSEEVKIQKKGNLPSGIELTTGESWENIREVLIQTLIFFPEEANNYLFRSCWKKTFGWR